MIWVLMAMVLMTANLKPSTTLTKSTTMSSMLTSIIFMSLMAMLLNYLMTHQTTLKEEKKMLSILTMVSATVMLLFLVDSALIFMVLMEMTVVPLAYMIVNTSKDKDKVESVKFMVMMNTAGSVPFMAFILWKENFLCMMTTPYSLATEMTMTMMMILLLVKTPIFLTHLWLTKAHVSATGNCSMILASIMIKMGTIGIFKFYSKMGKEKMMYFLVALSLVGSFYMMTTMFRYYDTKTLIAMSSILHMAILIPMMMMKKEISMISSMMMMTAHGIISYFLFYLITMKYETSQNRSSIMMKSNESVTKMMTVMTIMFMFLNLGIPPFMNFLSETMFLFVFKAMNSFTSTSMLIVTLMLSVMFTMQMNSSTMYGKVSIQSKKNTPMSTILKSSFFATWSFLILWTM